MRRGKRILLAALALVVGALYLLNASWIAGPEDGATIKVIAHRGVHQTFSRDDLQWDTCTATRIDPPTHEYLENTTQSMEAAFAAGADVVELDVHPTTDGHFAVFHDWELECRTDGAGVTRRQDLAYLKSLDIGFGYTADDGRTFPLRGTGRGSMPTLAEAFSEIPYGRFVVNFKSRDEHEGDLLAARISEHPEWRLLLWGVYGGDPPTFRAKELLGHGVAAWSERSVVDCLTRYLALGWIGYMPSACRDIAIMVPINAAPWLWGFPHRMVRRFEAVGSQVILVGPYDGEGGAGAIDTLENLERVPRDFNGYIWTNKVELIGPELKSDVAGAA